MEIQPSLVLLQKTLLQVEGLGRQLYPELDLWTTAQPFLEKWIEQRYSPLSILKRASSNIPALLEQLPHLPDEILNYLKQNRRIMEKNQSLQKQITQLQVTLKDRGNKTKGRVVILICLLSAIGVANPEIFSYQPDISIASWGFLALALLTALKYGQR